MFYKILVMTNSYDPQFPNWEKWSEQSDFFQSVHDFFQEWKKNYSFGTDAIKNIPDLFTDIWHWIQMAFDFIPDYFVTLLTWFIIAAMVVRFVRW